MEPIDAPIPLEFNNGNMFPNQFIYIAYTFLTAAVLIMLIESAFILGGVLMILAIGVITNRHIVEILEKEKVIHDSSLYFGFIKMVKKFPLDNYLYVTNMPLVKSTGVMANVVQTTTPSSACRLVPAASRS